jgi:hypothetical protein
VLLIIGFRFCWIPLELGVHPENITRYEVRRKRIEVWVEAFFFPSGSQP